jgi:hypothetical protein
MPKPYSGGRRCLIIPATALKYPVDSVALAADVLYRCLQ